jgi:hypothetical protein
MPMPKYSFVISDATRKELQQYYDDIKNKKKKPGLYFEQKLKQEKTFNQKEFEKLTIEQFLEFLVNTKAPANLKKPPTKIPEWNPEELSIKGAVGMVVPDLEIYSQDETYVNTQSQYLGNEDGDYDDAGAAISQIKPSFRGSLLFLPNIEFVADKSGIQDENQDIDINKYYKVYERRLLPLLVHANYRVGLKGRNAFITLLNISASDWNFRDVAQAHEKYLQEILKEHADKLPHVKGIYLQKTVVFSEQKLEKFTCGKKGSHEIQLLVGKDKPQLLTPNEYGDEFANCDLFSIVHFNPLDWPGKTFLMNRRENDSDNKLLSTNCFQVLAGIPISQKTVGARPSSGCSWDYAFEQHPINFILVQNTEVVSLQDGGRSRLSLQESENKVISYLFKKCTEKSNTYEVKYDYFQRVINVLIVASKKQQENRNSLVDFTHELIKISEIKSEYEQEKKSFKKSKEFRPAIERFFVEVLLALTEPNDNDLNSLLNDWKCEAKTKNIKANNSPLLAFQINMQDEESDFIKVDFLI